MSLGQVVPGTNPDVTQWKPVCPKDKPCLSLGQPVSNGGRQSLRVDVYVPFSLAISGKRGQAPHLRADFWEGDATMHFSVKERVFQ